MKCLPPMAPILISKQKAHFELHSVTEIFMLIYEPGLPPRVCRPE